MEPDADNPAEGKTVKKMQKHYINVLAIAGSDSGAGAGIQADLKTCLANGVYATTVISAVTAQNTCGVKDFCRIELPMIEAQLDAVITDVRPDAVKTGMLPDDASIALVGEILRKYGMENIVVDPVMVATSGDSLTSGDTGDALMSHLFPLATVVTPNIPEAERLSGLSIRTPDDILAAAERIIAKTGVANILIKGGHTTAENGLITDVLVGRDGAVTRYEHELLPSNNTHGTGCSLSSAIAANLAKGHDVTEACRQAIGWLSAAIKSGQSLVLGHGHGPVNHLWELKDFCTKEI